MKDERQQPAGTLDSLIAKNASPETPYLKQLKASHRARARAALRWRPRFLAALTLTASPFAAARAAKIAWNTYKAHERNDPDFAKQIADALEQGAEVLHAACWNSAIEGDLEPVYWQGNLVGHIKKYDSRIRIELLRAHMPQKFRRPDKNANVSIDNRQQFVVTPEVAADLAKRWRASQERLRAQEQAALPSTSTAAPQHDPSSS
jgi:hypothetical protein